MHDALTRLRDARTTPEVFRRQARRITLLLAVEATRGLLTVPVSVETPLGPSTGQRVTRDVVITPLLRAGLGMLEPLLELVPGARVGHVGLQRDETTAVASRYYAKLPSNVDGSWVLVVDPMVATGGSATHAIDALKTAGARDVHLVCIVCAPEGIARLAHDHPDTWVFTAAVDERLDARSFIVPGLGDFGDRLYGTS